jgi:ribosomal protein L30/L7E
LEDLKIQDVLKQEEGLKGIKGLRLNKIKQEVEVAKTR